MKDDLKPTMIDQGLERLASIGRAFLENRLITPIICLKNYVQILNTEEADAVYKDFREEIITAIRDYAEARKEYKDCGLDPTKNDERMFSLIDKLKGIEIEDSESY